MKYLEIGCLSGVAFRRSS